MLKAGYRYTKLEAGKSAAVGEQVENDGGVEGGSLSSTGAGSGAELLGRVGEITEVTEEAGTEPSCRNSRRRQVTVHKD